MSEASFKASRLARVAALVDQLALSVEPDRWPRTRVVAARAQIDELVGLLAGQRTADARALARALGRLSARLTPVETSRRARPADVARSRRLVRALGRIAVIVAAGAVVSVPLAAAAQTAPAASPVVVTVPLGVAVGDTIIHPVTGASLIVTALVPNGVIVTGDLFILTNTTVGAVLPDPADPTHTVTIASAHTNATTHLIDSVTFTNSASLNVVTPLTAAPGGLPGGTITLPAGAGDSGNFSDIRRAAGGGGGRDGALFVSANSGGDGHAGENFTVTAGSAGASITTTSTGLPGVIAASIGGQGGSGGDGYLGASGASGGNGGAGGDVTLTSNFGSISTTGDSAHGVVVQSRSGVGGAGGSGFAFSSGGSGGAGSHGGTATVTNNSTITTRGVAAHGVFAQSLGGGAGGGGGSYGLFGDGGNGNRGGDGGQAEAINNASVTTLGNGSFGVTAQSIGGIGGDAGTAVGLVTFTSDGAAGGNGGTAIVRTSATSQVRTEGSAAYGLFAQSIGGGGGNGGLSVGLASLGSGGGTGGNGGSAQIFAADGSQVTTLGVASHGVFAQSIGGGGGNGGVSAGVVAIGSRGTSGGTGGAVTVESGATVSTIGQDARGIFAQSIGGGGGNALGSGGLVALGGEGGGAGGAGVVSVTTSGASVITTTGTGADGIFAQSVGGGGGSGSSTGGVVALGGGGGIGGNGNTVTVDNNGSVSTTGDYARGVFAQSVGGGGGTGGDSGGLVTLGGDGSGASTGGMVTVTNRGQVSTTGDMASALQVQSIGGGGGDGGSTGGVFLTIGGNAGGGGGSGLVTVNNYNDLSTTGDDAHGVLAQSVGGGGGNGGSSGSISAFAGAAVGGHGGLGGDGGAVDVNFFDRTVMVGGVSQTVSPLIHTTGDRSRGVFAQSVGGGGGNGGFAAQVSAGYGVGASIAVGGDGGTGGVGGTVNLDGDLTIVTEGDYAEGIFAQSVGGGGGNGGFAISFSFAAGETAAAAFSVGVGGHGATGGAGGLVDINSGGAIFTAGQFSTGLLAQSVGGGGGNGGFAVSIAGSGAGAASASVSVGVGGSAGTGGAGGTVDATFDGDITTTGDDSRGALIQSVGGGGGNGGFAVSGAVSISGGGAIGAAAGVGGQGGVGGAGGSATGVIGGDVMTSGDRSTAVTVQSVGGGGGSGGFSVAGSIGGAAAGGGAVSIGIGGSGGGGGAGGAATGTVGGAIQTTGDQSGGLLVQSVGGGGGNGGFNVSGSVGVGGNVGGAISVGVGGAGGGGGVGGAVHGTAQGLVVTTGDQSAGVTVQSIGGGGGNGGFDIAGGIGGGGDAGGAISVGVGGSGGGGGDAGEVDAASVGIHTSGDQSGGFLAQSVGGGGGSGGFNVAGSIGGGGQAAAGVAVGVGGSGGTGGAGMRVGATVIGDVTTLGADSDGVVAQSIGGGGGSGGFNVSGSISGSGDGAGSISVGVGGSGGGGGRAGAVTLAVTGTTQTGGANSDAIVAQSVGGGGGSGGFAVAGSIAVASAGAGTIGVGVGGTGGGGGDGGDVTLHVNDGVLDPGDTLVAALTVGDGARGVLAQSIGGGGGNGGFSVVGGISAAESVAGNIGVGVGGGGGDGGDAGAVIGTITGDVRTGGDDASGVLVQSVGGGGGNGGFNVSGGIAGSQDVSGNLMVGVGGFGGSGGNAGAVSGSVTGDVLTFGDRSFGVAYQSLGGGGGNGAFNVTGGVALSLGSGGAGNLGIGVGGFGGDGGDAFTVNATITGDITTHGVDAYGTLLQSVGGGGGNGGFNITGGVSASSGVSGTIGLGLGGFGGGGGRSESVTGVLNGDVTTFGDGSFGAMLQSLGGAGGNGGLNVTGAVSLTTNNNASVAIGLGVGGFGGGGGDASFVDATVNGLYVTSGANADGVVAQSLGGGGGNGGLNVTGSIALGTGTSGTGSIGVGGFGGSGGSSANVDLIRVGDTQTDGANSDGIIAQSLAGGGGNGAINVSGGISASTSGTAGSLGIGVGGFGGGGGDAGDVTAHVTGNVHARGLESDITTPELTFNFLPLFDFSVTLPAHRERLNGSNGVVAQSIGGGGGNGGLNVTGQLSITAPGGSTSSRAVALGVGGFGGAGGDAGNVDLTIDAPGADRVQVSAVGDDRSAVIAQSVGGGGGAGGINISGGVAMDGQLTAGVGGFGGAGGLGRDVTADVDADLFASGDRSRGLMAQSIGGGGGAGGINISGGVTADPAAEEPSIAFGLGGFGGAGNRSGDVTVTQNGQVMVDGVNAIGVLVQSVAGGGGSGGLNVTADVTLGQTTGEEPTRGVGIAVGIGGTGGDGADAGDVQLTSNGNIFVNARPATGGGFESVEFTGNSNGILAQSIGGGGGVGGISGTGVIAPSGQPVAIGVGGSGGSGGDGGLVSVTRGYTLVGGVETSTAGVIRTYGDDSDGLVAQSIGGGGGRAGMNFTFAATVRAGGDNPIAALISVGGGGGGAGSGDDVAVRHNGDIITDGDSSDGLFAQSLGGGGGDADFNIGFGVLRNSTALNLAVGGAVGAGGSGGDVSVDHHGVIVTTGHGSAGIRAQSIGGGGGNTSIDLALGILANNSLSITIGRHGGTGGTGGNVTVVADGAIDTTGDEASGIVAQSIGGGGGASSATSVGASYTSGANTPDAASYSGNVAVGLDGGVGATSGDVSVDVAGTVTTRGDDSRGVFAQSIGGGGGIGGAAGSFVLRAAGAATVNVGGDGGVGAASGHVTVDNAATIVTDGDRSDGVLAQSIGGGGGLAGHARNIAIQIGGPPAGTTTRTASVNIGGTGGSGAVGGAVDVTNSGVIATTGDLSFGIRAQSIGGGGGVGGAVINVRAQGTRSNDSIDVNVGGSGGTGGAGGAVTVANTGLIYTEGRDAAGISANSIGGGGGDAGLVLDVVAGGTGADQQSHRFVATFGGDGGIGGTGGDVTVTNQPVVGMVHTGEIVTRGEGAYGIFAQSLGGGGGNGSSVISVTGLKSGSDSVTAGLTIGGSGGSGNTGGTVTVVNGGLIDTTGAGAHGILAQSIGGGGGNGGMVIAVNALIGAPTNAPLISIGGTGGDGGDGGDVSVTNTGSIVTRGADAHGILAQSIGGGGGNAAMGFSLTGEPNSLVLSNALAAVIGATGGGTGGTGGSVTVNHSGDITVLGDGSAAIKAESINGGGGTLTLDFSGIVGLPGVPFVDVHGDTVTPDPLVVARAGADHVSNMNAGSVTVISTGSFGIGGNNGVGSFDQSVGGGGGTVVVRAVVATELDPTLAPLISPAMAYQSKDPSGPQVMPTEPTLLAAPVIVPIGFQLAMGGTNGVNNNGGAINSSHTGTIVTTGEDTPGGLVQSIGGGGGRGVMDITGAAGALIGPLDVSLGGANGLNESGGAVVRTQAGAILTTGDLSPATILQSIGGGGGSASVTLHGAGATAALVNASLGANGGSGLNGGSVSGTFGGGVQTMGDHAVGLFAQSIGGGGGDVRLSGAQNLNVVLGGAGGAIGDGGLVSLVNTGSVFTEGLGSHGVFLQSIGGGGGAVFGGVNAPTVTLRNGATGDGGAIAFHQTGDIIVTGAEAYGVIAQSLGGGGGWIDGAFAGTAGGAGQGGAIDLSISGRVFAANTNAVAVFAQSLGGAGGGNISLLSDGLIRGGDGTGAGVRIDGGATNVITTSGSISAVSGLAVDATGGDDTVNNDGLVIGNIDLGSGDNGFMNRAGGTFIAFNRIDLRDTLGATGLFTNAGDFLMGLDAPLVPLDLANGATFGDFDAMGDPATNLLFGARVINTVDLDGDFLQTAAGHLAFDVAFGPYASDRVNVTGNATVNGTGDITLTWLENANPVTLFATGGVGIDNGLDIADTLALDYSVHADPDGVHLSFVSDFGQPFLNRNGRALGAHMDSAISLGGSGGVGRLMALIGNLHAGDEAAYAAIFNELNPEPFIAPLQTQYIAADNFSRQMFTCAAPGATLTEQCVWSRVESASSARDGDTENFSVDGRNMRFSAGFERPLGDGNWSLAAAVGYEDIDHLVVDQGRAVTDGEGFHGGLGVKRTTAGGGELAMSLSGGWQWLDTTRQVNVFEPLEGHSDPATGYVQANLRLAQTFRAGAFFARPALNLSATALHQAGFVENGLAGLGVEGLEDTQLLGAVNPELGLGFLLQDNGISRTAFVVTLGKVFQSEERIEMPYRLMGSNSDADPAIIGSPLEQEAWRVGVDFHVAGNDKYALRLGYAAEFGDKTDNHTAGLNLRVRF